MIGQTSQSSGRIVIIAYSTSIQAAAAGALECGIPGPENWEWNQEKAKRFVEMAVKLWRDLWTVDTLCALLVLALILKNTQQIHKLIRWNKIHFFVTDFVRQDRVARIMEPVQIWAY